MEDNQQASQESENQGSENQGSKYQAFKNFLRHPFQSVVGYIIHNSQDYKSFKIDVFEYKQQVKGLELTVERLEEEKNHYKKESEERGKIIDLVKRGKKEAEEFANYVVRERAAEVLTRFFENNNRPYLILTQEGRIVYCTQALRKDLKLGDKEIAGMTYKSLFKDREDIDKADYIKKLLKGEEKQEYDDVFMIEGKKVSFHITKEKSIKPDFKSQYTGEFKEVEEVTWIPLLVEPRHKWVRWRGRWHGLIEVVERTEEEKTSELECERNFDNIHSELMGDSAKWAGKISKYIDRRGKVPAYHWMQHELVKIEKKKTEEEQKAKAEAKSHRRKKARKKLTELKKTGSKGFFQGKEHPQEDN